MQERCYPADWTVPHSPVSGPEATWVLLQSLLLVNWSWDLFVWDLRELLRLLTARPAEFNYLFLTVHLKARAAYLAAMGPFDCPQQTILIGIGSKRVQFAGIYYRLLLPVLREVLDSEEGAKLIGDREERLFQLAIREVERRYIDILQVIALELEMSEVIHGHSIESWVTGTEVRNGKRVSALPGPVDVRVNMQRYGRHRLVGPNARDMVRKILKREAVRTFLQRTGVMSRTDIEFEKLSRCAKARNYWTVKYGDLEVEFYMTLTNTEKTTLYVVCADRTMRIHQRNGVPPGSKPTMIEVTDVSGTGEDLYLVTFDNGSVGIYAIDFRPHKEKEHDHVPEDVLRMPRGGKTKSAERIQPSEVTGHVPEGGSQNTEPEAGLVDGKVGEDAVPTVEDTAGAADKAEVPDEPQREVEGVRREAAGAAAPGPRHLIQRGVNTWRVVFDGVELPGLGKDRGMFFVAYLAGHAGADPIHALELEAKVSRFYRKDCGLTDIVDPDSEALVAVDAEAVFDERDLNLDNDRMAELLREEERKAMATIDNPKASRTAKVDALKKVEAIGAYRLNRFGKNSSPATDAVRRVRTAIDRLGVAMEETMPGDAQQAQAVAAFAEYVRKHIRDASANLWPKAGLRSRKAKWQPGHFQCNTVEGIDWVVT